VWDGSFHHVRIRGVRGALLWHHHTAASLTAWTIRKGGDGRWRLAASLRGDANRFQLRQTPLLFTAPREGARDGWWAWGVESVQVGDRHLTATLGPPEQ